MLSTTVDTGLAVGVGANQILAALPPVHGLAQLRVTISVTALVGAPSIVFDLLNLDGDYLNGGASAAVQTPVYDGAGARVTTAAVTTVSVVEILVKYPAQCRDAVAVVATNNVAATSATVSLIKTVAE